MNRIKPNERSGSNQENERDCPATAGDDHGYVSSIYQWGKNSLMNQIKPNNVSQKSTPADTTDGHSYLYNSGNNSSGNQIKHNLPSIGYYPNGHSGAFPEQALIDPRALASASAYRDVTMNRIKPNDRSRSKQENERDSSATAVDDHVYAYRMYQWGKNLMNPINPNNPSQKSALADTTDGHSHLHKSGKNSSGNQIKPNHPSIGYYPNGHSGASAASGYNDSYSGSTSMNKIKPNIPSAGYNRMYTGVLISSINSYMDSMDRVPSEELKPQLTRINNERQEYFKKSALDIEDLFQLER